MNIFISQCAALILLGGCSFQPLLKDRPELSSIKIDSIPEREGQILKNHLLDMMTPEGSPQSSKYRLKVILEGTNRDTQYFKDATPGRTEVTLKANISLIDSKTGKEVFKKTTEANSSFAIDNSSDYANVVYEENSKSKILRILAEQIKLQLASYFATQKTP